MGRRIKNTPFRYNPHGAFLMSLTKDRYVFKDKTWYIVPWRNIESGIISVTELPSLLIHDVNGIDPHRLTLWCYPDLEKQNCVCYNCGVKPSKKIQTLWTLENMDNPLFYDRY